MLYVECGRLPLSSFWCRLEDMMGWNMLNVSANGVHQALMMRIMPLLHVRLATISEKDVQTFSAAVTMTQTVSRTKADAQNCALSHRM